MERLKRFLTSANKPESFFEKVCLSDLEINTEYDVIELEFDRKQSLYGTRTRCIIKYPIEGCDEDEEILFEPRAIFLPPAYLSSNPQGKALKEAYNMKVPLVVKLTEIKTFGETDYGHYHFWPKDASVFVKNPKKRNSSIQHSSISKKKADLTDDE